MEAPTPGRALAPRAGDAIQRRTIDDDAGWEGDGGAEVSTAGTGGPLLPGDAIDALVDEVVARIEARVVDELERRGRRQDWGVV